MESYGNEYLSTSDFYRSMQKGLNLGFLNQIPLQDLE